MTMTMAMSKADVVETILIESQSNVITGFLTHLITSRTVYLSIVIKLN